MNIDIFPYFWLHVWQITCNYFDFWFASAKEEVPETAEGDNEGEEEMDTEIKEAPKKKENKSNKGMKKTTWQWYDDIRHLLLLKIKENCIRSVLYEICRFQRHSLVIEDYWDLMMTVQYMFLSEEMCFIIIY